MNKEDKFLFGDTPTVFITRVDHFLHCPTWFDELEPGTNSNFYETIGLEKEFRTPAIKIFHAMQAIQVGNWKPLAVHLLVAHYLATYPNSKIVIIDGYPTKFIEAVLANINEAIQQAMPTHNKFPHHGYTVADVAAYNNVLYTIQAEAKVAEKLVFNVSGTTVKDFVPEIDAFNNALQRYQEAQRQEQSRIVPPAGAFKPYLIKPEDDGQGGNTLQ